MLYIRVTTFSLYVSYLALFWDPSFDHSQKWITTSKKVAELLTLLQSMKTENL